MSRKNRILEIDFLRGIAILLMVLFHLIVDLKDFYNFNVEYLRGFWYVEGKISALLFIVLCGVSSTLSKNSARHGIVVFLWAMLLTLITYYYNNSCFILFGILHFLGISLLSIPLIRALPNPWLVVISSISIMLGTLFSQRYIDNPYLFPIGLTTSTFTSLDYYPLFPWYGFFLLGILIGKILYQNKRRLSRRQASPLPIKAIATLGKHSLVIYLVHQPLLLVLLYVLLP